VYRVAVAKRCGLRLAAVAYAVIDGTLDSIGTDGSVSMMPVL